MRPTYILIPAFLLLTACSSDPGEERLSGDRTPPAAAQLAPRALSGNLDEQLVRMVEELEAGMAGDPERLLRAEAITDGLMEARRPVDWLATGYDVEARLRQMQAMADRIVARMRRGNAVGEVSEEVQTLARAATDLRAQLGLEGGGTAPPPLDSLLAQDPLRDVQAGSATGGGSSDAEPAQTGGPLGQPVNE